MRKSFTRLLSLVMFLTLFSAVVAVAGDATKLWPNDAGGAAYTKTTDKIMVIYPGPVQASTGSVRVSSGGSLVRVLPATDSRISYAMGDTVVIDLSADLKELTTYTVAIDASTFKTVATTPVQKSAESWSFTTGDYSGPTLKSVVPVAGTVISPSSSSNTINLEMTFADASAVLLGTGNVALYKADGNVWDLVNVATQGTMTGTGTTSDPYKLTLTGIRTLEDNVQYAVTIGSGVVTDDGKRADSKKNAFAGLTDRTVWTFSTADFTAPGFATDYPKKGTVTNNSAAVLIKTTEAGTAYAAISTTTATISDITTTNGTDHKSVAIAAAGTEYSVNFTNLSEATQYYIHVVTKNADGVVGAEKYVSPLTSETSAPVLVTNGVTYYKGDTYSATATVSSSGVVSSITVKQDINKIVLDFNEEVKIGAGNVIIRKVVDNSDYLVIPSTDLTVSTSDKSLVTIPVSKALENNAKYYVVVPNTLILDKYDNKYAGITSTTGWNFTSNDVLTPTFTFSPAEGSSGVKKDATVKITFNELVQGVGSYNIASASGANSPFELLDGATSLAFSSSTSDNNGKFTTVTLTPSLVFGSSKVITIKIKASAISDYGSPVNAITTEQGISFVVQDYVGPRISANNSDANKWTVPTKPSEVLKVAFDEPIYLLGGGEVTANNLYTIVTLKQNSVDGANVPATYSIDANKKVITITPSSPWASDGTYYAAVSTDLQDMYGNAFDGNNRTSTFTIGDVVPSTVDIVANSADLNGQNISLSDVITFNFKEGTTAEDVAKVYYAGAWNTYTTASQLQNVIVLKETNASGKDVAFTVSSSNANSFTISGSLEGAKTYYLGIGPSTKDASDNVNVAKFVTFTTKYASAPKDPVLVPADNATAIAKNAPVTITFNCDIAIASTYGSSSSITINGSPVALADLVVDGKTLTIKHADFSANSNIDIVVPNDVIVNKYYTSQAFAGITTTNWNFATVDEAFASYSFAPDETSSALISDKLVLTGTETFKKGVGYIYIKNSTTDALVERIDVASSQVVITDPTSSSSVATITPSAPFKYGQSYYIEVDNGALVDVVGNKIPAVVGKTPGASTWTFTVVDTELTIAKVTPNNAEFVANNQSIVVEFNREIEAATGDIGFIEVTNGVTQTETYTMGSTNITISGKTLTLAHSDKLFPANSQIYLYMTAGSVKILGTTVSYSSNASRYNVAVNKTTTNNYSFFTGNALAPVPTFTPAAFDADAPVYENVNTNVLIQFNEEIYLASSGLALTNGDVPGIFKLLQGSTEINCVGTIAGRTVTLDPTTDLNENTTYTIQIVGGSIKDVAGNTITTTNITSQFKTYDVTPPVLSGMSLTPSGATSLSLSWTATDVNFKAFYYLVKLKSDAASPSVADVKAGTKKTTASGTQSITSLLPSTAYEVFYVAEDTRGNVSAVAKLEATTTDTVAPTLVSTTPAKGTVDVNVDGTTGITVKLTFSEPVQIGSTATITVRERATQAILGGVNQAALAPVTGDNKSLNLTIPTSIISASSAPVSFYVEIAGGSVKDQAATPNSFGGAFGPDAIYFTTEDNAVPTVVSRETATPVALNSNIKIKFSEAVQPGTGTAVLYKDAVLSANAIQVFKATEALFDGQYVTFNPDADFVLNGSYIIVVNDGFALDKSANKNPNPTNSTTVTFTASADLAPIATVTPAGGSTALDKNQIINGLAVSFSEDVYYPIAGYSKSLLLMNESEVKSLVTFVDGTGAAVAFNITGKSSTGFTVTPTNASDIKDQTAYTLTISGFQDNKGQVMTTKVEKYTTSDQLAPTITFNPVNKKTAVDPNASLTLTFSEKVYDKVISANDNIFSYIDNLNVNSFVYLRTGASTGTTSVDVPFTATIDGLVITIKPTAKLESGVRYYYGLARNVEDVNGTVVADPKGVYFDAADYTAPKLLAVNSTNFAPLGTSVSATASMWVKFSETVVVSTGSVTIRREDGTIFQTVSGTGLTIKSDDDTVLKIAHNNFEPYTNYFVEIGASAVVDKSGNPNALFNDPTPEKGWLFTTSDTYALTATVTPSGDNTPRSVSLEINFNKVLPSTAAASDKYVAVYKADGTAVYQFAANDFSISGKSAIRSNVALDADQAYYARIEPNAFVDGSGNKFAGIMDNSWAFSTINNIAPKVVTLLPADNAVNVDAQTSALVMTFDRNIAIASGTIAVRFKDGSLFEEVPVANTVVNGKTLTINLSNALKPNSDYYVIVPATAVTNTEITKDAFAGILNTYTWNFTTSLDQTAPKLVTWTPNATTIADNHPTLVMTFDESVVLGAGNVKVVKASDNTTALSIPVTSAMVSGKTVTVTYVYDAAQNNGLDKNTDYYVLVDAGVVKDAAANDFAGVTATTTWTFTTGKDFATGIDPVIDNSLEFKVYPNPFVDYVIVSNASELTKIVVTNIAGQVVKEVVTPDSRIQLNELHSGFYFISLYQGNTVIKTVKIAKR